MNKLLEEEFWNTASVEDVKKALDDGAEVNARDEDGNTPLLLALEKCEDETIREDIIKKLLEAGAGVNVSNDNRNTPLLFALSYRVKEELVVKLIKAGSDVEADVKAYFEVRGKNNDNFLTYETPLHSAVRDYSQKVIQMLLDAGADVNSTCSYQGRTPLHVAARFRETAIIELLLNRGADANALDEDMNTPLEFAQKNKRRQNTKTYSLLKEAQYRMSKKDIIEAMHYYKASELIIKADSNRFTYALLRRKAEMEVEEANMEHDAQEASSARRRANNLEYRADILREEEEMMIHRAQAHHRKATGREIEYDRKRDEQSYTEEIQLSRFGDLQCFLEKQEKAKRREKEKQKKQDELIEAKRQLTETEDPEEANRLKTEISSLESEIRFLQI